MKLYESQTILRNIMKVRKPSYWEELYKYPVDLDDVEINILKELVKLNVYNIDRIEDIDKYFKFTEEDGDIKNDIQRNNFIFYSDLNIKDQFFILNFKYLNIGILVNTEGFSYMRYVTLITEFNDTFEFYKKEIELGLM